MSYVVNCDGSIQNGNPGGWACGGWVLKNGDGLVMRGAVDMGYHEDNTNNTAEYAAVLAALTWAAKNIPHSEILVKTDSQLIVRQLSRKWKCAKPSLMAYRGAVWQLEDKFKKVLYKWVPRAKNKEADFVSRYPYYLEGACAFTAKEMKRFSEMKQEVCVIMRVTGT